MQSSKTKEHNLQAALDQLHADVYANNMAPYWVVDRSKLHDEDTQVMDKRKKFNKYVKEFAPAYGIPENVTSSVIRNSYATRANNLGVPMSVISEMLGHSDLRTTQIYLDSLPKETTDEYHRKILD